jgi:hypothetical protein
MRELNNRGSAKHLLLLGPESLAVFAGVAANASGAVTIPLWNGSSYTNGVTING